MAVLDFIEELKAKPHHVKNRIAFVFSAGFTGVVALGWAVATLSSGTLTLVPHEAVSATRDLANATGESANDFSNLLGATRAFDGTSATTEEGTSDIVVVDTKTSSTLETENTAATATSIPF